MSSACLLLALLAPSVSAGVVKAITEHGEIFKLDTELFELSGSRAPKRDNSAEQLCTTNASNTSSGTSPNAVLPEASSNNQVQSSHSIWSNKSEPHGHGSPGEDIASQPTQTCEVCLQHPEPVHTASPLLTHDAEGDPWVINQYIISDPRFRDSALVFPRTHYPSNPSWPFLKRYRVTVLTVLATLVAFGFILAAIIGSVTIKSD
ncbi:unnamed protein product [Rhizoctonia solani]|uniref:Uncharacterized protein n=1 Tax=Rhizoctonia solani TaxID=456999 RepID=A0A8H3AGT8_9AGAM|nr:unnamed protein product [Rhizoctonia solani]